MAGNRRVTITLVYIICAALGSYSAKLVFDYFTDLNTSPQPLAVSIKTEILPGRVSTPIVPPAIIPAHTVQTKAKPVTTGQPSLVLNGIVISAGASYALINNKIIREGDKIEATTVVRITKDSVELKDSRVLKLKTGF